jgi:hypothetical protein
MNGAADPSIQHSTEPDAQRAAACAGRTLWRSFQGEIDVRVDHVTHHVTLTTRLAGLLALCLTVVWLARAPDWEPLLAVIVALAAQVTQELAVETQRKCARDAALYAEFLAALPFEGSIQFLSQADFGGLVDALRLSDLERFSRGWTDARHEFLDRRLNTLLEALRASAAEFRGEFTSSVFPYEGGGELIDRDFYLVPREWSARRREAVAQNLRSLGDAVVRAHQELVRAAERQLGHVVYAQAE